MVPENFRKSLEIGSDLEHMTQTSAAPSIPEDEEFFKEFTEEELQNLTYKQRLKIEQEREKK